MALRTHLAIAITLACGCQSEDLMLTDQGEGDDASAMGESCPGAGGDLAEGEACTRNVDCASGVCSIYTDAPINADAVCVATPADCATHFTGTVLDYASTQPVPGVLVNVTTAGGAVTDSYNAPVIMQMTADDSGRYVSDSPGAIANAPLAMVALAWDDTHPLTASGLAQPIAGQQTYEVGAGLHEVWLVPGELLADWSAQLQADEGIDPAWLPLSEVGAIVGRVRDGTTGEPIAGAQVVSVDGSDAVVRYVADDGTIGGEATGSSGDFLLFGTAPVETFAAIKNDVEVGRATLGFVPRAVFVSMIQSVP